MKKIIILGVLLTLILGNINFTYANNCNNLESNKNCLIEENNIRDELFSKLTINQKKTYDNIYIQINKVLNKQTNQYKASFIKQLEQLSTKNKNHKNVLIIDLLILDLKNDLYKENIVETNNFNFAIEILKKRVGKFNSNIYNTSYFHNRFDNNLYMPLVTKPDGLTFSKLELENFGGLGYTNYHINFVSYLGLYYRIIYTEVNHGSILDKISDLSGLLEYIYDEEGFYNSITKPNEYDLTYDDYIEFQTTINNSLTDLGTNKHNSRIYGISKSKLGDKWDFYKGFIEFIEKESNGTIKIIP